MDTRSPLLRLYHRFARLGLQKRIMLYVIAGLSMMFGVLVLVGLGAIEQATELVYEERLVAAHTTASMIDRDIERLAADVRREASAPSSTAGTSQDLLDHLTESDSSPFFRVSGVWQLRASGALLDAAGSPAVRDASTTPSAVAAALGSLATGRFAVVRAPGAGAGEVPFAAVAIHTVRPIDAAHVFWVIHTVSINSVGPYVPALHHASGASQAAAEAALPAQEYHLEVLAPDGVTVLGVGEDEVPGEQSPHRLPIVPLMASHRADALLHEPGPNDAFEAHVMAVVPMGFAPLYVVLEQPVDVALALPLQLREQLLFWIGVSFVAALIVAWITTRRVVEPTERLTAAAERMAGGDLVSPIGVVAPDEIGKLAESLDLMRQRLKEAYEAIELTNRELEARVSERTARLSVLLRKTISAQEHERQRLARELHDETAQTLAALSVALDRARDGLACQPGPALDQIGAAKEIATRLLDETRRLILGLRPAILDDLGLAPAVRWHCESALSESGIDVTIEDELGAARLPSPVEITLFRIAQEAVSNVARHARARHMRIRLTRSGGMVSLRVADDGRGFDAGDTMANAVGSSNVGLLGMNERVALMGGTLTIQSKKGAGTTVLIEVPLAEEP